MSRLPELAPELRGLVEGVRVLGPWSEAELSAAGVPVMRFDAAQPAAPKFGTPAGSLKALEPQARWAAIQEAGAALTARGLLGPPAPGAPPAVLGQRAELALLAGTLESSKRTMLQIEIGNNHVTHLELDGGNSSLTVGAVHAEGSLLLVSAERDDVTGACTCLLRTPARFAADLADHLMWRGAPAVSKLMRGRMMMGWAGHTAIRGSFLRIVSLDIYVGDNTFSVNGDKVNFKEQIVKLPLEQLPGYLRDYVERAFG